MATTAMVAQFLQHGFDPGVAGRCLLVVGVVKRKCLLERKQMLGAIASGERLRDRLGAGVATVMAQARQRLRIALAGKDRAYDTQAGRGRQRGAAEDSSPSRPSAYAGCVRPRTPADARADARRLAARQSSLWAESWPAATRMNGAAAAIAHR